MVMLKRGGLSCSHYFSCFYVYGGDDYLVNLKIVSKATECHDFTAIFPFLLKMHRNFADFYRDFLTALILHVKRSLMM